jgi:ADP-heptose:LPS heptosyltransferase
LGEIRALFLQSKITVFTYNRYWSELDLFDYFDDVAAVTDDHPENLGKIIRDCEIDFLLDAIPAEMSHASLLTPAPDTWAHDFHQVRTLKFTFGASINIYVKNHAIDPALDDALASIESTPARVGGALHRDILREIELATPLNTIALFPWPRGVKRDKATHPPEHWVMIAHQLIKAGFEILIPGTAEDYTAAVAFKDAIGMPGVRLSAGRATLRQTAILLGRTRGAICAPGSIAYMTSLAGAPLVVLDDGTGSSDSASDATAAVESLNSMLAPRKIGAPNSP